MGWLRRLRSTIVPSTVSVEFDEETRFHLDELTDEYVRQGMTPNAARLRARRQFGNVTLTRERTRDSDTFRWFADAVQDLRFASRSLRAHPGFTIIAVLTLALGIGANTAIFTLFDAILLRPLPVADPSRLILFTDDVSQGTTAGDPPTGAWPLFSTEVYRHLRDQALPFASLGAVRSGETTVLARVPADGPGVQAQRASAHLVSGNYFRTMGVDVALGRPLAADDDRPNARPAAVVSEPFWRLHLHANPGAVGTTLILNATAFTIVGVTPPGFFGERVGRPPDAWVPLTFQPQIELRPSVLERSDTYWLNLIGRLAPGASLAQAQTAATAALQQFLTSQAGSAITADRQREIRSSRIELAPGITGVSGLRNLYAEPLHVLLAVVGLVLLIACANVANLLLTRAAARRGEISMRVALGAGRGRLIRQLLTESLLLAGLGAGVGILLAQWATRALMTLIVSPTSPVHATLSEPVLLFTIGIAVAAGMLFGIAPAAHATRFDLVAAMKSRQGGGTASRGRSRAAATLVAVQIAVSLVLLVGASLFARSLLNVEKAPLGFNPGHVLLARLNPRLAAYTPAQAVATYQRLYNRLIALPGVESATFAYYSPLSGASSRNSGMIEGYVPKENEPVKLETVTIGPAYSETLGIPVRQGRAINARDLVGGPKVCLVNEALVRRYFPNTNPIGRHLGLGGSPGPTDLEVVGVLADAQFHDPRQPVNPMVFTPMLQQSSQSVLDAEFAVRTSGDPGAAAAEVRRVVGEVDPNLPVNDPKTLQDQVSKTFDSQRLAAQFVAFFGLLALTLAAVGLYGTISQNVARRTSEIGLRMALGAERSSVVWMILSQTLVLLAIGLLIGLPSAILGARLVASQLFGVGAIDPPSFAASAVLLIAVAVSAGLVPARRATQVDPVVALRSE